MKKILPVLLGLALALPALAADENKWNISKLDASKLPPPASQSPVTFDADIKPMFEKSCGKCHGEQKPRGGFQVGSLDAVLKGGKAGKMIVPGDSAKSLLVLAISQQDPGTAMPPRHKGRPGAPPAAAPPGGGGPRAGGVDQPSPQGGPNPRPQGPPAKPLTPDQVALVRAWIDQGAK